MRRSYRSRPRLRDDLRAPGLELPCGLEAILLHPAVESATAQSQSFRGMANIPLRALQRFADQNGLHRFQAEFFQVLTLSAGEIEAQVGSLNLIAAAHEDSTFECVFQFAHIARPGILHEQLQSRSLKTLNGAPVACCVTRKKMDGQSGNVFPPFAKCRDMNLHCIQAKQQVLAKLSRSACRSQVRIGSGDYAHVHAARA